MIPPPAPATLAASHEAASPAPARDWPWWLPTALALAALAIAAMAFLWRQGGSSFRAGNARNEPAEPTDDPVSLPEPPPPPALPDAVALALRLEPVELHITPGEVRLAYRLLVTNRGKLASAPLVLAADMISAHAALPASHQLLPDSGLLPTRHLLGALSPGGTVTLSGEMPLPMAQVLPILIGDALGLVPLVRWMALDDNGPTGPARIFALGRPGADEGAPMLAFRLDLGPARHGRVAAREIETAQWLSLDWPGMGG